MKERPILFSGPMVCAILEGRKSQTRRVIRPQPRLNWVYRLTPEFKVIQVSTMGVHDPVFIKCPYGQPGERLWVRETIRVVGGSWHPDRTNAFDDIDIEYRADSVRRSVSVARDTIWGKFIDRGGIILAQRTARFMPRWASRILLEITGIRVEQMRKITAEDYKAEGVDISDDPFCQINRQSKLIHRFSQSWDFLNAKHGFGWDKNPWVWVITFNRIDGGK